MFYSSISEYIRYNCWLLFFTSGMGIHLRNLLDLSGVGTYINKIKLAYQTIYTAVHWGLKNELSLRYILELFYAVAPEAENFSSLLESYTWYDKAVPTSPHIQGFLPTTPKNFLKSLSVRNKSSV